MIIQNLLSVSDNFFWPTLPTLYLLRRQQAAAKILYSDLWHQIAMSGAEIPCTRLFLRFVLECGESHTCTPLLGAENVFNRIFHSNRMMYVYILLEMWRESEEVLVYLVITQRHAKLKCANPLLRLQARP